MWRKGPFLGNDRETNNETTFAARQQILIRKRLGKHVPAAMDTNATIEGLLDTAFSTRSVPKGLYNDDTSRVEAGSNTSTVALRVVGGDEKGTQCLGV
jgi:hypothetical protein